MKLTNCFLILCFLLASPLALADVPTTMQFQGYLTDGDGEPLSGSHDITFTLYGSVDGDDVAWADTQTLTLTSGAFTATLGGDSNPLDANIFGSDPLWLGVKVGEDDEMTPRHLITSVPYAARASVAALATEAENALSEQEIQALIDAGSYLTQESDPTVNSLATAALSCEPGFIPKWDVTGWDCAQDEGLTEELDPTVNALARAQITCDNDSIVRVINGGWTCDLDRDSGGDITGVEAGVGLSGGGEDGAVTLNIAFGDSGTSELAARSDHDHGTHTHDAEDIGSGTLDTDYYSAYADLSAEGRLDIDDGDDLLTLNQGYDSFATASHSHSSYQGKYYRTVVVRPGASAQESGSNLKGNLLGISGASETNPWLLKIEPGIYDLDGDSITMKQWVDIEGSGQRVTRIVSSIESARHGGPGTVRGVSNAAIRRLTIENTATGDYSHALFNYDNNLTVEHVTIIATANAVEEANAVFNYGDYTGTMQHVTVLCPSSTAVYTRGIYNRHIEGPARFLDMRFEVTGGNIVYGIENDDGVHFLNRLDMMVNGQTLTAGIRNNVGTVTDIANSRIRVTAAESTAYGIHNYLSHDSSMRNLDVKASNTGETARAIGLERQNYEAAPRFDMINVKAVAEGPGDSSGAMALYVNASSEAEMTLTIQGCRFHSYNAPSIYGIYIAGVNITARMDNSVVTTSIASMEPMRRKAKGYERAMGIFSSPDVTVANSRLSTGGTLIDGAAKLVNNVLEGGGVGGSTCQANTHLTGGVYTFYASTCP